MKRSVYILLLGVFTLLGSVEAQAQKYKERRFIRSGNESFEKGNYVESDVSYRRAIEKDPESVEANYNLAASLYKQGQFKEATQMYEVITSNSELPGEVLSQAHYNRGNALFEQKEFDKALESYKAALRLNPSDTQAKFNLAYTKKMIESKSQESESPDDQKRDDKSDKGDKKEKDDEKKGDKEREDDEKDGDDKREGDKNKDDDEKGDEKKRDEEQRRDEKDDGGKKEDEKREEDQKKDQKQDDKQKQESDGGKGDDKSDGGQNSEGKDGKNESTRGNINLLDAEQMLNAVQMEEDKTRKKQDARKVESVGASGKNW